MEMVMLLKELYYSSLNLEKNIPKPLKMHIYGVNSKSS
jgi:hypothetical protein